MEVIKVNTDIDIIVERFRSLITDEIGSDHIAEMLDDILFKYASYLMDDKELCSNKKVERNELYWIRKLRDLFINKDIQHES